MRPRKTFAGYPTSRQRKRPPWRWKKSKFSWNSWNEDEWHWIIFVLMTLFYPQPPVQTKTSSKAKAKAFRNNSGRAPKAFGPRGQADGSEASTAQALRSVAAQPASHVCFFTIITSTFSSAHKFHHHRKRSTFTILSTFSPWRSFRSTTITWLQKFSFRGVAVTPPQQVIWVSHWKYQKFWAKKA